MFPLNNLIAHCDVICIRWLLHNEPDTHEELLDHHLAKEQKPTLDDDEAELLNRILWRDILRVNAQKEFDAAWFETDPEIVTWLLLGGQDAVESTLEKLAEKQRQEIEKERCDGGD
uniref:Uncharacterized protein n=1 Tax=Quercus lobata TaxID=97700 RepID=A0A7N2MAP8_QUELO